MKAQEKRLESQQSILRFPAFIEGLFLLQKLANLQLKLGGRRETFSAFGGWQIDAAQNQGERGGINFDDRFVLVGSRSLEAAAFQTLGPYDEPVAVPEQDLAAIAAAVKEHEQIPVQDVELERILDDRVQAVEALSHVRVKAMDKDTRGR